MPLTKKIEHPRRGSQERRNQKKGKVQKDFDKVEKKRGSAVQEAEDPQVQLVGNREITGIKQRTTLYRNKENQSDKSVNMLAFFVKLSIIPFLLRF